jgi:hypothetical protein
MCSGNAARAGKPASCHYASGHGPFTAHGSSPPPMGLGIHENQDVMIGKIILPDLSIEKMISPWLPVRIE